MWRQVEVLIDLGHIAGNEPLHPIGLGDQTDQLLLILRSDRRLEHFGGGNCVPVAISQRLLETRKQIGNRFK